MAVTSIHAIKATVGAAVRYITDGDKTVDGLYVNSYACRADSAGAAEDFRAVRNGGTGRTKILAHHIIQIFESGEITPEKAMQIGEELCDKFLHGDYQYVLAVHTDKAHIHTHIIFNNTNLYNRLSFTTEHNQGKISERSWAKLRNISDEICKENGLLVIEPKGKGVSHFERDMQLQGQSWKDKLRAKIAETAYYSRDFADFLRNCTASGIEYVYKPSNKVKLKFRLKDEGQKKFTRADTLGEEYTAERIAEQIAKIQKVKALTGRLSENKITDKIVAPSKPAEMTKIESKPTVIEPKNSTIPTQKSPPKKEDFWAEIRGMRNSDMMISNHEKGGIKSFADFSTFFLNTHHSDDHTDELAALEKEIKGVEKFVKMMKQKSKNSKIYKEYSDRSALTKKHFRKKNSVAIDNYEQANKYINAHVKDYYIDDKPPKLGDLEDILNEMKSEFNALLSEHNAFLKRKKTAVQYAKSVRNYLQNKAQQERNREYEERKRTQRRNRNELE